MASQKTQQVRFEEDELGRQSRYSLRSNDTKAQAEPTVETSQKLPPAAHSKKNVKAQKPSSQDLQNAKQTEELLKQIGFSDLRPVVKDCLLDSKQTLRVPFYTPKTNAFIQPFSLGSKAPFASNQDYSFLIANSDTHVRLSYAFNKDQLLITKCQQYSTLYTQNLLNDLKLNDRTIDEEHKLYMKKVYLVGAMNELQQQACFGHMKPISYTLQVQQHTQLQAILDQTKSLRKTFEFQAFPTPVLNPSYRNVLTQNQCENFYAYQDHLGALVNLSGQGQISSQDQDISDVYDQALKVNQMQSKYSDSCLNDLIKINLDQDSYDEDRVNQAIEEWRSKLSEEVKRADFDDSRYNKDRQLCTLQSRYSKIQEPATSINVFINFANHKDYVLKAVNNGQLNGQQMLRNPLQYLENPADIQYSLAGAIQAPFKNFINNTVFMTGSYENQDQSSKSSHKVDKLTGKVVPMALGVFTDVFIKQQFEQQVKYTHEKKWKASYQMLYKLIIQTIERYEQHQQGRKHPGSLSNARPIVCVKFEIDGRPYSLTTNCKVDQDGVLQFRKPQKKDIFPHKLIHNVGYDTEFPTLLDLAYSDEPSDVDYLNCMNDFNTAENIIKSYPDQSFKLGSPHDKHPCYELLLLFLAVCSDVKHAFKDPKTEKFVDLSLFILVCKPLSIAQAVHEHALCNMSGGDSGQHIGIINKEEQKKVKRTLKALIITDSVSIREDQASGGKYFTDTMYRAVGKWPEVLQRNLHYKPFQSLNRFQRLKPDQQNYLISFSQKVIESASKGKSVEILQKALFFSSLQPPPGQTLEDQWILLQIGTYFAKGQSQNQKIDTDELVNMATYCQQTHLMPFFIMKQKFQVEDNDAGLVPTTHMICLNSEDFNQYISTLSKTCQEFQLGALDLSCGRLVKKWRHKLCIYFTTSVYRLLHFYLKVFGKGLSDQFATIMKDRDTYTNFTRLIGCEQTKEKELHKLDESELDSCREQVFDQREEIFIGEEPCALSSYGKVIKMLLITWLSKNSQPSNLWPKSLQTFANEEGYDGNSNKPTLQFQMFTHRKRDLKAAQKSIQNEQSSFRRVVNKKDKWEARKQFLKQTENVVCVDMQDTEVTNDGQTLKVRKLEECLLKRQKGDQTSQSNEESKNN